MSSRPGITFETVTPSVPDALPRMDVAGFVGFATRGPIDVPVPVEDVARFRDVFGPPLDLVPDGTTGRMKRAHLHRTVEAFFRNGGRRCWVVRVANSPDRALEGGPVRRTAFRLPGLVGADTGRPPSVRARSYGATFDDLRVGTVLRRRSFPPPSTVDVQDAGMTLEWRTEDHAGLAADDVQAGDLLRVELRDQRVAYAVVGTGEEDGRSPIEAREGALRVHIAAAPVFDRACPWGNGPDDGVAVHGEVQVPPAPSGTRDGPLALQGTLRQREEGTGRRSELAVSDVTGSGGTASVSDLDEQVVHLDAKNHNRVGWVHLGRTQAEGQTSGEAVVREALWPLDRELRAVDLSGDPEGVVVERVRFDLVGWREQELRTRLDALGLAASHERAWTDLPVDETLFGIEDGEPASPASGSLAEEVCSPRFPFAASGELASEVFLPLGMAERATPERTEGRVRHPDEPSRLGKERLSAFSVDAFLDDELEPHDTSALRTAADDKVYLDEEAAAGIHSLWSVREVTLLGVPDATHRGWTETTVSPQRASTPVLPPPTVERRADPARIHLSWMMEALKEEAVEVEVQEASDPSFDNPTLLYRGDDTAVTRYVRTADPQTLFFRLRLVEDGESGAWSNTRSVSLPAPDFEGCPGRPGVPAIEKHEGTWLRWAPVVPVADPTVVYEIQIADTAALEDPKTVWTRSPNEAGAAGVTLATVPVGGAPSDPSGGGGSPQLLWYRVRRAEGAPVQYVRVRARRMDEAGDHVGGWSRTVAFQRPLRRELATVSKSDYETATGVDGRDGLFRVHQALLRMGAARGDILSVLSLPEEDQPDDVEGHVTRLRTPGDLLRHSESRTRSYGALYYPWGLAPDASEAGIAPTPPEGAVCGRLARNALTDGAWTAAANEPLAAVRTVVPPLQAEARAELSDRRVNVFEETPRGVLTLGSATLAGSDVLPNTVPARRLLILVRRLVRREAPGLVFENNTPDLRRRIADRLDGVMRTLFRRGAFAGDTPSEAYRIVADESVNPPERVDRGQLVVTLRVAPVEPLQFVTVRLVQYNNQSPRLRETGREPR